MPGCATLLQQPGQADRVDHLHAGAFIQSSCILSDLADFCSASGLNTSELAERQGSRTLDFFQDEAGFHIFNALLLQQFIHHKA
jgi:hypothetical protein